MSISLPANTSPYPVPFCVASTRDGFAGLPSPAIDRVRKAGPIELTSAPPSQQPIDVRAESPRKVFHPLDSPLLNDREEAIRKEIEKLFPSDMTGRINTLVTLLAAKAAVLRRENGPRGQSSPHDVRLSSSSVPVIRLLRRATF